MQLLAENKKIHFDYDILETLEGGIVLTGQEVKAAKQGQLNLKGSFVTFHNGNALLTNAHLSAYRYAGVIPQYDPTHSRRLLLHKKEINYLRGKSAERGLTIVPLKVYTNNRRIKIELGVARGKHTYDKRATIKKRELQREINRYRKQAAP